VQVTDASMAEDSRETGLPSISAGWSQLACFGV
jgi:hypothetical protein